MYKMVINAPCLESLIIIDDALTELSVSSSNYLVKADIGVSCALKALKDILNVQELSIYERKRNCGRISMLRLTLSCPYSIS